MRDDGRDETESLRNQVAELRALLNHTLGMVFAFKSAIPILSCKSLEPKEQRKFASLLRYIADQLEGESDRYGPIAAKTLREMSTSIDAIVSQ